MGGRATDPRTMLTLGKRYVAIGGAPAPRPSPPRSSIRRTVAGWPPPRPDGTIARTSALLAQTLQPRMPGNDIMNSIIYLVGLIVIVMAILSLVGLN